MIPVRLDKERQTSSISCPLASVISLPISVFLASTGYWLKRLPCFYYQKISAFLDLSNAVPLCACVCSRVSSSSDLTRNRIFRALRCWAAQKRNAGYPGSSSLWSAYPRWLPMAQGFLRSIQWASGTKSIICGCLWKKQPHLHRCIHESRWCRKEMAHWSDSQFDYKILSCEIWRDKSNVSGGW